MNFWSLELSESAFLIDFNSLLFEHANKLTIHAKTVQKMCKVPQFATLLKKMKG